MHGKSEMWAEPSTDGMDEFDYARSRRDWLRIFTIVGVVVAVSLILYRILHEPNRHLEATPYDRVISQLRASMSQQDVLNLFKEDSEVARGGEISSYDEPSADGAHRVLVYKLGPDDPLTVKFGGVKGDALREWCYRDHCHDNID
ncbi:MAG TPA: hypothetical protein VKB38_24710 [Terracidiphilus sp.]|nr:hypothetical protein [Terracidiphilus sp.]